MPEEAVFYLDVLGFRSKAGGRADAAVDALTALAEILGTPPLIDLAGRWTHKYSLSDSVFLTQAEALPAVIEASQFVFNLVLLRAKHEQPVLVRGAVAFGNVR